MFSGPDGQRRSFELLIGIDYTAAVRQRAGIGRYARELISALMTLQSDHEYVIFAATGGLDGDRWKRESEKLRSARSRGRSSDVRFCALPLSDDWMARLWHRLRLPVPVETFTGPLDVFYSPDFVLPPTRRSTQSLLTVHDLSYLHYPEHFVPKLVRYLEQSVSHSVDRADWVLADSEATRLDLIAHLGAPSGKVKVLYSGVDPRFNEEKELEEGELLRARYGLIAGSYVLSVGTIQPRKNYVRLIQAFAQLQAPNLANIQLAVAGGRGWLYEDIFAEAEIHGDRVRILGFVDEADLPALYRNATLFTFPSLYEGFGLPVLEAMACGTPVVCSNVSSLPEVAGDAALLVDPRDTGSIAEAMARVLQDADLQRDMVARGRSQAARFTWKRSARQLLEALDGLANA
jgi:glycosyltransferase involved in cell wall biosynthesis